MFLDRGSFSSEVPKSAQPLCSNAKRKLLISRKKKLLWQRNTIQYALGGTKRKPPSNRFAVSGKQLSEAGRKIDTLQSEKTALERQIAAADDRIANVERYPSGRDQLVDQKAELGAFEAAQKQTALHEEELAESINELRLGVATGPPAA